MIAYCLYWLDLLIFCTALFAGTLSVRRGNVEKSPTKLITILFEVISLSTSYLE